MESPVFYVHKFDHDGKTIEQHKIKCKPDSQTSVDSIVTKAHIAQYPKEHEAFLASLKGGDPESVPVSTPKKISKPKKEKSNES